MAYFNTRSTTEVIVDASPVGLAAILTQKKTIDENPKIIAFASRSLTDVERRYSQTEKEGLAIVWRCEHFNLYLSGHRFHLITVHKPLELIFNNPKSKPPARIERWALRLQAYDYKIIYRPGKIILPTIYPDILKVSVKFLRMLAILLKNILISWYWNLFLNRLH